MSNWNFNPMGLIDGVFGNVMAGHRARQQHRRTKELMDIQQSNQMELNEQGNQLGKDMFDYTFMPIDKLKQKGMNPSLLYGMGGAGGTTAGSPSGGSAQGGQGSKADTTPLGMLNAMMINKQLENIDAGTEKTKEEAREAKADADIREIDARTKEMFGKKTERIKLNNDYNEAKSIGIELYDEWMDGDQGWTTLEDKESKAQTLLKNKIARDEIETRIAEERDKYVQDRVKYEYFNTMFDAKLKEANINLTKEKERKLWHDIWQGWTAQGMKGLDTLIKGRFKSIGNMGK